MVNINLSLDHIFLVAATLGVIISVFSLYLLIKKNMNHEEGKLGISMLFLIGVFMLFGSIASKNLLL